MKKKLANICKSWLKKTAIRLFDNKYYTVMKYEEGNKFT